MRTHPGSAAVSTEWATGNTDNIDTIEQTPSHPCADPLTRGPQGHVSTSRATRGGQRIGPCDPWRTDPLRDDWFLSVPC